MSDREITSGPKIDGEALLFYRRPELLIPEKHGTRSLVKEVRFEFARGTNSVPLTVPEFVLAQRDYPIVFSERRPSFPIAVLGLRDSQNMFVADDGTWRPGRYVPAYERRYPFTFMSDREQSNFALCIDSDSELIREDDENPLFVGDQPSEITRNALTFCAAFQRDFQLSQEFCAALEERGLFQAKSADITAGNGTRLLFGPFRVVDEQRFHALAEATIGDWHRRGWLAPIYAHLMSFANWSALAALHATSQAD